MSTQGIGPNAVTGGTYAAIQAEMEAQDLAARRLKPGLPEIPTMRPGAVPPQPANVWNDVDRSPVDKAPPGPWVGTKLSPE